jgi:uncharacterized protein with von Willebrand factor type A (vWA) domain
MSLAELQRQVLAERARILEEIEREFAERNAPARAALAEAEAAAAAARAAEAAEERQQINARKAARAATAAARKASLARQTRKRGAGANWEIAGRPAHLGPGAPMRPKEKSSGRHVTRRVTRAMKARGSASQSRSRSGGH